MDQNDPARQPYAQPPHNITPIQRQPQHQQRQQPQSGPQQILQNQQSFNQSLTQFAPTQSPSSYRGQGSVGDPSSSGHGRGGSENANLYFSQGLPYGAGSSAQAQYSSGLGARGEGKSQSQSQQLPSGFGTGFVYGMPSGLPQQLQQVAFDQSEQTRHRSQPTAETLPSQYEETQGAQYYSGMQAGPSTTPANTYGSSHFVQQYATPTYNTSGQSGSLSAVPGTMMQSMQQSAYSTPTHQQHSQHHQQQQQQQQQQFFGFQQQPSQPQPQSQPHQITTTTLADSVARYQTAVRSIFTQIRAKSLRNVQQLLTDITRFLTSHVAQLGLTHDSEGRNDENNYKFWDEYNRAWLTTLQCQFDTVQTIISGRQSIDDVYFFDRTALDRLGEELIALCDKLEKHGLVDYQMGVAEDEIIEHMLRCLKQLEDIEPRDDEQAAGGAAAESRSAS